MKQIDRTAIRSLLGTDQTGQEAPLWMLLGPFREG